MQPTRHPPAAATPRPLIDWQATGWAEVLGWPLPHLSSPFDRFLARAVALLARGQVRTTGPWGLLADAGPFVLVANHTSRREALYLPALLMLARGGRPVHFMADWNFRLIPGVGYLYRRGGAITVTRKPARPRVLDRLRPRFETGEAPMAQAGRLLGQGEPVGIFPEGTVNRDPHRLLRGRFGAARLSLECGVPVIPLGIRLGCERAGRQDGGGPMTMHLGTPLAPPPSPPRADPGQVHAWHGRIMTALAALSGKDWPYAGTADSKP